MRTTLAIVLVSAACGSTSPPSSGAPKAVQTAPQEGDDVETISGTIASIRFQNINKARDHYTYNVELVLERPNADPISVRVDKIFWSSTPQDVRDAIAPDGPEHELSPKSWREWKVGDTVQLRARVTSPGLALLVP